jgi:hypothetical protein
MTVPAFSAVTSRAFEGSPNGWHTCLPASVIVNRSMLTVWLPAFTISGLATACPARTIAGATALHALGRAIALASRLAAPDSASRQRAPRPPLLCRLRRELGQLFGCRVLRLGVDRFGRRAIKGDALVMAKRGLAVDLRHSPTAKHAERIGSDQLMAAAVWRATPIASERTS